MTYLTSNQNLRYQILVTDQVTRITPPYTHPPQYKNTAPPYTHPPTRILFEIASSRRYAPKGACAPEFAHICAKKRRRAKPLATNIETIPKNMSTNFQLKQLKLKLDIVEKPENRVHKLTDSNVSHAIGNRRGFTEHSCKVGEERSHKT